MKKVGRKAASILLTLCMLLTMLPVSALAAASQDCSGGDSCMHEAAIGTTHYDTIGEAIDAANGMSGSDTITVTLLKNAAMTGGRTNGYYTTKDITRDITLDLGGHTLEYAENGGFLVNPGCHFTVQNGTYINTSTDSWAQAITGSHYNSSSTGATITVASNAVIQAVIGVCADGYTTLNVYGTIDSTKDGVYVAGPKNDVTLDGAKIEAGVYGVYQQGNGGGSSYDIKNSTITTPDTEGSCAVFICNSEKSAENSAEGMQTLNIENSVISGQDGIEVRYTNVTISGDQTEVTSAEDGYALGVTHNGRESAVGNLSITGGTFTGDIWVMKGTANTATLTIFGGNFSFAIPEEYCAEGFKPVENADGTWGVVEGTATETGVAQIGNKTYETLEAAFAAVGDNQETTITLLKDIAVSAPITIGEAKNVIFDMKGHTITAGEGFSTRVFTNNGTLTITGNGTIDVTAADANGYGAVNNFGTLTVVDGTYRNLKESNASTFYNRNGGTATFENPTIYGGGGCIGTEVNTTTTINGGYYENETYPAVENRGNMTITAGTFKNTSCSSCDGSKWGYTVRSGESSENAYLKIEGTAADSVKVTGVQGGLAVIGGTADIYNGIYETVACDVHTTGSSAFYAGYFTGESYETAVTIYDGTFQSVSKTAVLVGNDNPPPDSGAGKDSTVMIKGGTFIGGDAAKTAITVENAAYAKGGASISGGTFSSMPSEEFFAEGFKPEQNEDGTWGVVTETTYVAQIGETEYATLSEALNKVRDGETIKVLAPATVDTAVTYEITGKTITLNLNGQTVAWNTSAKEAITVKDSGSLTIQDTSANEAGELAFTSTYTAAGDSTGIYVNLNGALTLQSGTISYTAAKNGRAIYVGGTCTFAMSGGTVEIAGSAKYGVYLSSNNSTNITGGKIILSDTLTGTTLYGLYVYMLAEAQGLAIENLTVDASAVPVAQCAYCISGGWNNANNAPVTISGGTYTTNENTLSKAIYYSTVKNLTISGGTFNGVVDSATSITDGTFQKAVEVTDTITGGTFEGNVTAPSGKISGGKFKVVDPPYYWNLADGKSFEQKDGYYCVVDDTSGVAQIGNQKYETLEAAINAAQNGDTVKLIANVTMQDGILLDKDADIAITLDLNGFTYTVQEGANVSNRGFKINSGTLNVIDSSEEKTGEMVAVGSGTTSADGAGAYGVFRVEANGHLNVTEVTLRNSRPWGLNVKICGGTATLTDVEIISSYGGGIEVTEANLGEQSQKGQATMTNCTVTQTGYFDHCSSAVSVSGGSKLIVNGGTYTSDGVAIYVFSSGGEIEVIDGTFSGKKQVIRAEIDTSTYPEYTGGVQIKGGSYTGDLAITSPASLAISGGTFSVEISEDYCAEGFKPVKNEQDNTWGVVEDTTIFESGSGTAEDPYIIMNATQLGRFRDSVNSGTNYSKQYIKLGADIDLSGVENWEPIGNSTNKFQGIFDGTKTTDEHGNVTETYIISNLTINRPSQSDVGLFGFTTGGEVKNFTLNNANVTGYLDVGAVAGTPYTSKYTNINVTGTIQVNGFSYVGGAFGKNAYANITDVDVTGDTSSYVKAHSIDNVGTYRTYVGGLVGFMGEGNITVSDCDVKIDVTGSTGDIGGILGILHYGNTLKNCTYVGSLTLTTPNTNVADEFGALVGTVYNGSQNYTTTIANCTATVNKALSGTENVTDTITAHGDFYNSAYGTDKVSIGAKVNGKVVDLYNRDVAKIGDISYNSLVSAVEAAKPGDTITLLGDIDLIPVDIPTENGDVHPHIVINKNLTLDLAGYKIAWDERYHEDTFECTLLIINITDGAEVTIIGNGTIDTEAKGNNSYGIELTEGSKLTIENGTFTGATTAVQVTEGKLTILDGTFIQAETIAQLAPYYAKYVVNAIDPNWADGTADISIQGGSFCFDPSDNPEGEGSSYVAEGFEAVVNTDGSFEIAKVKVAEVGDVQYATLTEAINAASDGQTIKLLADSTGNTTATISDGRKLTLDMNGFNAGFSQYSNISIYHGGLNITGSGKLYEEKPYFAPVVIYGSDNSKAADYTTVTVGKDVTLEGWSGLFIDQHDEHKETAYGIKATVKGTLHSVKDFQGYGGHALYVQGVITATEGNVPEIILDGATLNTDVGNGMYLAGYAKTTITNSTITSTGENSTGIEIRAGKLTISGNTTVSGGKGEFVADPNGNGSTTNNVALAVVQHTTKLPVIVTVEGGTFNGGAALYQADEQDNGADAVAKVQISVEDGTFNGVVYSENKTNFITGGTFSEKPDEDYCAEGYAPEYDAESGTWDVVKDNSVAEIVGGEKYESLIDAVNAAKVNGQTVKLLADVELKPIENQDYVLMIDVNQSMTLDLNGHKITATLNNTKEFNLIKNYGGLTITDDSEGQKGSIEVTENGSHDSARTSILYNGYDTGKFTLEAGTLKLTGGEGSKKPLYGVYSSGTTVVMNGGAIEVRRLNSYYEYSESWDVYGIYNSSGCQTTVNGGTITVENQGMYNSAYGIFNASGTVSIHGDPNTPYIEANAFDEGTWYEHTLYGNITLYGGKYNMLTDTATGWIESDIIIADGYEEQRNGDCTVSIIKSPVAQIGSTKYDTLEEALKEAKSGDTIKLLQNVALTDRVIISKNITLNLNDKTISSTADYAFIVNTGSSFTLENGTLSASQNGVFGLTSSTVTLASDATINAGAAGITATNNLLEQGNATINVYGTIDSEDVAVWGQGPNNTINVDGATITSKYFGVYQNGSFGGTTITIKNSTITDESENGTGIYVSNNGTNAANPDQGFQNLIIENSTITGNTAVEVKFTNVTISGDDTCLTATGTPVDSGMNNNGSVTTGYAFAVTHNGTESSKDAAEGTVTISGGKFTGAVGIQEPSEGETTSATISISGGSFSEEPKDDYLAPYYDATKGDGDTYWTVDVAADVEAIWITDTDTKAGMLSDLLGKAESGTVQLLKNVTTTGYVTVGTNVTLDLAGKTLDTTNSGTFSVFGKVVDSTEGKGLLKLQEGSYTIQKDNPSLPIYDRTAGGYRLYTYQLTTLRTYEPGTANTVQFWFKLTFTNEEAWELLTTGNEKHGITVKSKYQFSGQTASESWFSFNSEFIHWIADQVVSSQYTQDQLGFYLNVTNTNLLGERTMTVTPAVDSVPSVGTESKQMTYSLNLGE